MEDVKTCIVKVIRVPNAGSESSRSDAPHRRDAQLHVFDRARTFVEGVAAKDEVRVLAQLDGAGSAFFEATRDGRWVIGTRVPNREW